MELYAACRLPFHFASGLDITRVELNKILGGDYVRYLIRGFLTKTKRNEHK